MPKSITYSCDNPNCGAKSEALTGWLFLDPEPEHGRYTIHHPVPDPADGILLACGLTCIMALVTAALRKGYQIRSHYPNPSQPTGQVNSPNPDPNPEPLPNEGTTNAHP